MAEAKITLSLTPHEFDIIRDIIANEKARAEAVMKDVHTDAEIRHNERQVAAEMGDLLSKLQ